MTRIVVPGKYVRLEWWHLRRTLVGIRRPIHVMPKWWQLKRTRTGMRRIERILRPDPAILVKLWKDITDEDWCQRGPDGKPLGKITPFVSFLDAESWKVREAGRRQYVKEMV